MRFTIDRIDHLVLNVKDVEITATWYQRVLGMEREEFGPKHRTALKFGGQKINVRPAELRSGKLGDRSQRPARFRRSLLHHRRAAGCGDRPSARMRRHGSRRAGEARGRARADAVGVLPRPGRQPGRDLLLHAVALAASADLMAHDIADFDFDLPPDRIAQHPARPRDAARLLHVTRDGAGRPDRARPAAIAAAGRRAGGERHAGDPGATHRAPDAPAVGRPRIAHGPPARADRAGRAGLRRADRCSARASPSASRSIAHAPTAPGTRWPATPGACAPATYCASTGAPT